VGCAGKKEKRRKVGPKWRRGTFFRNLSCNFWNFKSKRFSNSNKDLNLFWK
jgi:hypothetical protein